MLDSPQWCDVRQHYCRCTYSERCDRYDRESVVEELKKEPSPSAALDMAAPHKEKP